MKKKRLKKKNIIILTIILLIIIVELINPIKLYNKHLLRELNYSETSINVILENNLKDQVLENEYNKNLDKIFSSSDFNYKNYSIYKDLNSYEINDYVKNVNKLIEIGYSANDINNILKTSTDESLKSFLEKDYIKNISDYLQYDFAKLENYDRYLLYKEKNNIDNELVVVYVNIGLDKEFYEDTKEVLEFSTTMLVNKYNGLSKDFVPDNLIKVDSSYAVDSKQQGNEEMLKNFYKMSDDCKVSTGYKLLVRSGYRDYKNQQDTYDLYLKTYGKKYAENYVTHAGYSEHQTGLAVDIKAESSNTFKGTKENKWLIENAYKYGFILRYTDETEDITGVKYESWHYRYVGLEIANYLNEHDMTYDEYYIRFLDRR